MTTLLKHQTAKSLHNWLCYQISFATNHITFATLVNDFALASNVYQCTITIIASQLIRSKWFHSNPGIGNLRPAGRMRPVKAIYQTRDLFSCFNDRYAAINRRNDSHLLAKTFFVVFATDSSEKRSEFLAKTFLFLFWSSPSIRLKKGRRPFSFGSLEWWRPAGTLLGLNVAH